MNMEKLKKNNKGITLLVLVITIIILLILAGITISSITGDNGIIRNAGQAKEQTEIANEKEIVEKATVQAMGNNKYGNIEESELQEQLNKETKEGKTKVSDVGKEFEVIFNESNRYYTVDKDGNVEGAYEIIEDKYPGDITVGKNGEELDGNEKSPYEIWCIEDLVKWSQNSSIYVNSYIRLGRTLDFKSNLSYTNGKMLGCNSIEELKELLTNTSGNGFTPILNYNGNFNGLKNEIKNIYINKSGYAALFANANNATIKNLKISGEIISKDGTASGFIAHCYGDNKIENLENSCNVLGYKDSAGIIGIIHENSNIYIQNCINNGNLNSDNGNAGGIIGISYAASGGTIINFYIYNSCNNGNINARTNAGGIVGSINSDNQGISKGNLYNIYNIGNVSAKSTGQFEGNGAIYGQLRNDVQLTIKNAFMLKDSNEKVGVPNSCLVNNEKISGFDYVNASILEKSYMQSSEFIEVLNRYTINNQDNINTIGWSKWVYNENNFPTLDSKIIWNGTEWEEEI